MSNPCEGRSWHYDDLSCCHVAIPNEDMEVITAAVADALAVLTALSIGGRVPPVEVSAALAGLVCVDTLLPTVSESESRPR